MADEIEPQGEDEVEVPELEEETPEEQESETEEQPEGEDDGEIVISIGDEAAPASDGEAPEWVRELRKRNRELERRLAEAEKSAPSAVPEVGEKPTLADCDYDEERYEQELDSWKERKATAERAQTEAEQASAKAQERWHAELSTYAGQKDKLAVKDFGQVEEEVISILSPAQQAILIQGAESKALLVYALGKNPEKLRELASITDPIKFAFAAARLEGKTKMERRPATSPEGRVRGGAPMAGTTDKTLERLEKQADRTGDRTELLAYRRKLRERASK